MTINIYGVEVDESLGSLVRGSRWSELLALLQATPRDHFLRATAYIAMGKFASAEDALTECRAEYPVACRCQFALIQILKHQNLGDALFELSRCCEEAEGKLDLLGAIWHFRGIAEGKLRRTNQAVSALLQSLAYYQETADAWGQARVRDTLGTLEAARGKLEQALHCYAMALVDKSILGDRAGMAITLGNIGRIHLRAGRYREALESFERDLEICRQLDDQRGICRMLNDLGRTRLANGQWQLAEEELTQGVRAAEEHGFDDIAFYCHKDLVTLWIQLGNLTEARRELDRTKDFAQERAAPYVKVLHDYCQGQLWLAESDHRAIDQLKQSVDAFAKLCLPDLEINACVLLARAYLAERQPYAAERILLRSARSARTNGYACYLAMINELMAELDLSSTAESEVDRNLIETGSGTSTTHAHESTPTSTDNYLLRHKLGGGAFGTVYRAYDSLRGIEVALKTIQFSADYNGSRRSMLIESARTELEAASRVRHPGVVRVYAIGFTQAGDMYICQEFIQGDTLRTLMDKERQPTLESTREIWSALCHSLAALHAVKVVHRDLKPHNVLMRAREQPVLIDFGIAQLRAPTWFESKNITGTLPYMAPEQTLGKSVDARADLYALGVMMYEWFSGQHPIHIDLRDWRQSMHAIQHDPAQPITNHRPDLPPGLASLIHQLLAKKARRRPSSALDVAGRIEDL